MASTRPTSILHGLRGSTLMHIWHGRHPTKSIWISHHWLISIKHGYSRSTRYDTASSCSWHGSQWAKYIKNRPTLGRLRYDLVTFGPVVSYYRLLSLWPFADIVVSLMYITRHRDGTSLNPGEHYKGLPLHIMIAFKIITITTMSDLWKYWPCFQLIRKDP